MGKLAKVLTSLLVLALILGAVGCDEAQDTAAALDSDGDGWTDAQEQNAGTNPSEVDTDGDGYWDPQDPNPLDRSIPVVPVPTPPPTPTPTPAPTPADSSSESQEIASFLQDDHINAVLSEEWNIFDEWAYIASLFESSSQMNKVTTFMYRSEALGNRASRNYQDILETSPPQPLRGFWDKIGEATNMFWEGVNTMRSGLRIMSDWQIGQATQAHGEAWLELKHIGQEHNIPLQWSLPR